MLLPAEPTPGFNLLSLYCDEIARKNGIPLPPLMLKDKEGDHPLRASIIAQTHRSLILRADDGNVLKILPKESADLEASIHSMVDGTSEFLLKMIGYFHLPGFESLRALKIAGCGRPLTAISHADLPNMGDWFNEVHHGLLAMHAKCVLHRDLKPSNIILVVDQAGVEHAYLNDFDCSFIGQQGLIAGTQEFQIHRTDGVYTAGDDLCSLCLTFASCFVPVWQNSFLGKLSLITFLEEAASSTTEMKEVARTVLADLRGRPARLHQ